MRTDFAEPSDVPVDGERRVARSRRSGRDRRNPTGSTDVTRIEHENLCEQVEKLLYTLRRIERELQDQQLRMATVEKELHVKISRRATA